MHEMWIGAILVCLYVSGCAIVCLSEESKIWKEAYNNMLAKYRKTDAELKHLKTLRLVANAMENENRLE